MSNFENINDVIKLAVNGLQQNGVFTMEDFFDDKLCGSISDKVMDLVDNKIDKKVTKEYDDYWVLDPTDRNRGSNWMDAQSKPVINLRGNHGDVTYDTGFCDIFNPNILFKELDKLKNHEFFKNISRMYNKNPNHNYCNIYYNNGITDTRNWHKDAPMIKFFVYLTDVSSEEYGPYCYLPKSHLGDYEIKELENYQHNKDDIIKFTAPKGTLIGSYQHGFHRGLPQIGGKKRVLFVYKIYLN
mgnify:FL=1|tara:strand:- start:557 stop:1282 length:726 start_codon:yes stop_codon:yes gene_type:complete